MPGRRDPAESRRGPLEIEEAYHGAIDHSEMRRLGIDPDQVIDFSTNINPYGPSPRVRAAVGNAALDRYPDRQCQQLRQAIAAQAAIDIDRIIVGNGSSELLQSLAQLLLQPTARVMIIGPTYGEYARASHLAGASVEQCVATADEGFSIPAERIANALQRRPNMVFLCNPNNPTGQIIQPELILSWARSHRETLFIVDESYIEFSDSLASLATAGLPNLIVLRSMTKAYALAGLRLGYAVADPDVIARLCRKRVPWNVNAPAQAAGVAAIQDQQYLETCLARLRDAKRELGDALATQRYRCIGSAANFFLVPVTDAAAVRERLLSHHLLVRDCSSFGIANHIRIAVRTRQENAKLMAVL